jgi:trehalose 6-phosphate synthase
MGRVIIISNRLPVIAYKNELGQWDFKPSSGGLVTAVSGLRKAEVMFYWLGWLGILMFESIIM